MTGFGIPCMFNRFTGYLCPGCGTSRMALAMLRLDFSSAFRFNPVAFVTVILWLMISIGCFAGRPAALRNERVLQGLVYVNIAAYLIFAVLRNLWYAGMQSRGSSVGYGSCADMPDISEQLHVCGMYLLWIADWLLFSINIKWPYKHICRGRYGKEYFNG